MKLELNERLVEEFLRQKIDCIVPPLTEKQKQYVDDFVDISMQNFHENIEETIAIGLFGDVEEMFLSIES